MDGIDVIFKLANSSKPRALVMCLDGIVKFFKLATLDEFDDVSNLNQSI